MCSEYRCNTENAGELPANQLDTVEQTRRDLRMEVNFPEWTRRTSDDKHSDWTGKPHSEWSQMHRNTQHGGELLCNCARKDPQGWTLLRASLKDTHNCAARAETLRMTPKKIRTPLRIDWRRATMGSGCSEFIEFLTATLEECRNTPVRPKTEVGNAYKRSKTSTRSARSHRMLKREHRQRNKEMHTLTWWRDREWPGVVAV
jgi:hypothetical protein